MLDQAIRTQHTQALLDRIGKGDAAASAELFALAYGELRELAERAMRGERAQTLQPTALVHEVCLRLLGASNEPQWTSKSHLIGVAARAMRSILVDRARRRRAAKRGGGGKPVALDELAEPGSGGDELVLGVDGVLEKLAREDPELARLVELRFFAGLSVEEAAESTGVSVPTLVRRWRVARAWLARELQG